MKTQLLTMLAAVSLFTACSKTQNVEQASKEFSALPLAVQQTVRNQAPNAEIADVSKHNRDGRNLFEVKFREPGQNPSIWVAEDGTVVRYDEKNAMGRPGTLSETTRGTGAPLDLSALPVGVQKAINDQAPKADVSKINRIDKNGMVVYEVQYVGKGANPTLHVTQDGKIVEPLHRNDSTR